MNTKERLDQLMTALDMLPSIDQWDDLGLTKDNLVFPNGTDGITEAIAKALICYSAKQEDEETPRKLAILAYNSAFVNNERGIEPTESDLQSLALAINAGWLSRNLAPIIGSFHILQNIVLNTDYEFPDLATAIFLPTQVADDLKEHDPYEFLE
jgi:hypothetical protein